MSVTVVGKTSSAGAAYPTEELIDLGLDNGLQYFADLLAAERLEGRQKILARWLGDYRSSSKTPDLSNHCGQIDENSRRYRRPTT